LTLGREQPLLGPTLETTGLAVIYGV